MKTIYYYIIAIILLEFIACILAYSALPAQIAVHWNAAGMADGFAAKGLSLFALPILSTLVIALLHFIPRLDPKWKNIVKFQAEYERFILAITLFLGYVLILSLLWNLGVMFNFSSAMLPAFALFIIFCGRLISKAEPNWTIGIRTPWTLSDETVWAKTHALGAKLFYAVGIIAFLGVLFPEQGIWLMLGMLVVSTVLVFVYSYFEYRKLKT